MRVLHALYETPGVGLAELSEQTGLHENTLRDHVRILEDEGFVRSEMEHNHHRGRPRKLFWPVRGDVPHEGAQRRVDDAIERGDLLRRIIPPAVHLDQRTHHQLDAVYEHLDDVGLQPELDEEKMSIDLTPCPFQSLIEGISDMVCHLHTLLIEDVLVRAGGPVEVDRILPFRTATSCRVHLAMRSKPPDLPV